MLGFATNVTPNENKWRRNKEMRPDMYDGGSRYATMPIRRGFLQKILASKYPNVLSFTSITTLFGEATCTYAYIHGAVTIMFALPRSD